MSPSWARPQPLPLPPPLPYLGQRDEPLIGQGVGVDGESPSRVPLQDGELGQPVGGARLVFVLHRQPPNLQALPVLGGLQVELQEKGGSMKRGPEQTAEDPPPSSCSSPGQKKRGGLRETPPAVTGTFDLPRGSRRDWRGTLHLSAPDSNSYGKGDLFPSQLALPLQTGGVSGGAAAAVGPRERQL